MSIKSIEESVSSSYHIIESVVEEGIVSFSTSNMSLDAQSNDFLEFSMAFNMRLTFVKTNNHNAQLYQDSMSHWVVKVKGTPIAFDTTPWISY